MFVFSIDFNESKMLLVNYIEANFYLFQCQCAIDSIFYFNFILNSIYFSL